MSFLKDKKILIVGVANKFSIAAGIAESMHSQGANIILSYQSDRLKKKVEQVGSKINCEAYIECDVSDDKSIANLIISSTFFFPYKDFQLLKSHSGKLEASFEII